MLTLLIYRSIFQEIYYVNDIKFNFDKYFNEKIVQFLVTFIRWHVKFWKLICLLFIRCNPRKHLYARHIEKDTLWCLVGDGTHPHFMKRTFKMLFFVLFEAKRKVKKRNRERENSHTFPAPGSHFSNSKSYNHMCAHWIYHLILTYKHFINDFSPQWNSKISTQYK